MLKQSDIAHYLLSLGLVKPRDVVAEDLTIVDASRRNCVFLATTRAGPTYVVKQAGLESAPTLAHEAAVLAHLADAVDLAGQVPTVVRYEPEAARLVLSTPGGARDWSHDRFPRVPARILGRALASLHRLPADGIGELPDGADRMWGLTLTAPSHKLLLDLSAAGQDVVARMQASTALSQRLNELRDASLDGALVHGDLRWDNCLAFPAPGSRRRTRVLIVDWELAGGGEAAFDLGTVLAEYLRVWVGSIPIVDARDPARMLDRARLPLRRMWPAMRGFWSAYGLAGGHRPTRRRVAELAAVRLLQTAVERTQGVSKPTAHVTTLVQLAENMLGDPDGAALGLLGLHE